MGIARSTYYGAPAADRDAEIIALIEAICAEFEAYGYRRVTAELRHQGLSREQQEGATADARAWPVAEAATALRHYDGQRPRRADLPQLGGRHGPRWTQPAVGGGHHLRRHCDRLRLPRRDPGCLVTPGCRLRDQPLDRCPSHHRGARRGGSLTGASRGLRASQRPRFATRIQAVVATSVGVHYKAARQAPPPAFSSPVSFSVGH